MATVVQGPNNTLLVYHVERATFTRVTFKEDVAFPAWTPDSRRLLYSSPAEQGEELYVAAADGSGNEQRVHECQPFCGIGVPRRHCGCRDRAIAKDGG